MANNELHQLLEQEVALVNQLIEVLGEEKSLLSQSQYEKLPVISEKKQELSEKLEASAHLRIALFSANANPDEYRLGLKKYLGHCTGEQAERINQLNTLLAEKILQCREANLVNGQVISTNISTRQEILHAITNQTPQTTTYSQDGQMKPKGRGGRYEQV